MKIENIKDLQKVIQLCRKAGVDTIKIDGVELKLGELPTQSLKAKRHAAYPDAAIEAQDTLTEEELLFYSATGQVSNQWR